ncbi:hypothetical protein evm_003408 [Chilo suppressalis]|nr:hypothetical protein evm_003408 [Chilo suppressalis]
MAGPNPVKSDNTTALVTRHALSGPVMCGSLDNQGHRPSQEPCNAGSKQAVFDGKRAIRGGIPFVFPQFGQWAFGPQHGFARVARWHVEKMPERLPSGDVEAVFSLMDDDFTRSMWHFQCPTPDVREYVDMGLLDIANGKYQEAYNNFVKAADQEPTNIMVRKTHR